MLENIYPGTFRGPTPAPDYFFKICQTFKSNTHRLKRRPLHIRKIKKFTKVLGFDTITIEGYMLPKICTRFISLYPNHWYAYTYYIWFIILPFLSGFVHLFTNLKESLANWRPGSINFVIWSISEKYHNKLQWFTFQQPISQ